MNENSLQYYRAKSKSLILINPKKISLLSNFTIDGLSDVLQVMSYEQNMHVQIYQSAYDNYRQEIFDSTSNWKKSSFELTFLILDFESMMGNNLFEFYSWNEKKREDYCTDFINEFKNLIETALTNSSGKIIVNNFPLLAFSPMGIFDHKINFTLSDLINNLNSLIRQLTMSNTSLFCIDFSSFLQQFGSDNIQDQRWKYLADMKISPLYLPTFGEYLIGFLKPLFGKTKKCLVLDLDNTLWGGIVGEDGINGIKLDEKPPGNTFLEFQKIIKQFYDRGIILAINSKNNLNDVMEVFEKHPKMVLKLSDFASYQINWNDKASNMKIISEELNIGLDSLVFWDDDPVNRELIKQTIPEVYVVDVPEDSSFYAQKLMNLDVFHTFTFTDEDSKKGKIYAEQEQRKNQLRTFSNLDDFLLSLNMEISIEFLNDFTVPRVSQLTMKTNQFNLTTKRYSEEQIKSMSVDINYLIKTFSVSDKFGDNGLTGLYIIKKTSTHEWNIDTFLMSCRIMGRKIEDTMLNDLLQECKNSKIKKLTGIYLPTMKNDVTKDLYLKHGFSKISDTVYVLELFNK
jgi:FkbH-like protein